MLHGTAEQFFSMTMYRTEAVATQSDPAYTKYTTYILGEGAFDYIDVGAKVAYETFRDPKTWR